MPYFINNSSEGLHYFSFTLLQVALEEEQLIRQREANETALAAIGARKRPKSELADNMNTSAPTNPRFRSHRINMRDVVFLCENDTFLKQSKLLFKLHVK